ncbi:MAG: hypothetical protein NVSMB53_17120 [Gemmatimonadaceae bacterium]
MPVITTKSSQSYVSRVFQNVVLGARIGLGMGAIFTVWVTVVFLVSGTAPFHKQGTSYPAMVALYLVGGPVVGAIIGLFRPLIGNLLGAVFVCILASVPLAAAFLVMFEGPPPWTPSSMGFIPFAAVVLGTMGGFVLYGVLHEPAPGDLKKPPRDT